MGYNTNHLFDGCRIGSAELRVSVLDEETAVRLTAHVFVALKSDNAETGSAMLP